VAQLGQSKAIPSSEPFPCDPPGWFISACGRADGISALQVEAVHLACARHETFLPDGQRAGFYLGDGPGVGKGRQIAALVTENILRKRGNERVRFR